MAMSMLNLITIAGYRSILNLEFRLKRLNVICGANGSGKSNLYKALRLLAFTAQGNIAKAIAKEGGMKIQSEGEGELLNESIETIFPGSQLIIRRQGCSLWLELEIPGIQRSLHVSEFSDGTLRYLCLLAALLSPIPAPLLVLNEPENSLHPDVILPLSNLIRRASTRSQVWVTTHSQQLANLLSQDSHAKVMTLHKVDGETKIMGQGIIIED